MAHSGNPFTLTYRDQLVQQATQQGPIARAVQQGNGLQAAFRDFSANLIIGAVPKTISGFAVIFPYPWVAYQGWIGGIVSVRADHTSRLDNLRSAGYYLLTLLFQVIPYSLAVGAGVNLGLSSFRNRNGGQEKMIWGLFPREALWDVGRIYILATPLFLAASLWEFLSPWNI